MLVIWSILIWVGLMISGFAWLANTGREWVPQMNCQLSKWPRPSCPTEEFPACTSVLQTLESPGHKNKTKLWSEANSAFNVGFRGRRPDFIFPAPPSPTCSITSRLLASSGLQFHHLYNGDGPWLPQRVLVNTAKCGARKRPVAAPPSLVFQ